MIKYFFSFIITTAYLLADQFRIVRPDGSIDSYDGLGVPVVGSASGVYSAFQFVAMIANHNITQTLFFAGVIVALIRVAYSSAQQNGIGVLKEFVFIFLVWTLFLGPSTTVFIKDARANLVAPSTTAQDAGYMAFGHVDNIPFGLAIIASFSTTVCWELADLLEDAAAPVSAMPDGGITRVGFNQPSKDLNWVIKNIAKKDSSEIYEQRLQNYIVNCAFPAVDINSSYVTNFRSPKDGDYSKSLAPESLEPAGIPVDGLSIAGISGSDSNANYNCKEYWVAYLGAGSSSVYGDKIYKQYTDHLSSTGRSNADGGANVLKLVNGNIITSVATTKDVFMNLKRASVVGGAVAAATTGIDGIDDSNRLGMTEAKQSSMIQGAASFAWLGEILPMAINAMMGFVIGMGMLMALFLLFQGWVRGISVILNYAAGFFALSFSYVSLAITQGFVNQWAIGNATSLYYQGKGVTLGTLDGYDYLLEQAATMQGMAGLFGALMVAAGSAIVFYGESKMVVGAIMGKVQGMYGGNDLDRNSEDSIKSEALRKQSESDLDKERKEARLAKYGFAVGGNIDYAFAALNREMSALSEASGTRSALEGGDGFEKNADALMTKGHIDSERSVSSNIAAGKEYQEGVEEFGKGAFIAEAIASGKGTGEGFVQGIATANQGNNLDNIREEAKRRTFGDFANRIGAGKQIFDENGKEMSDETLFDNMVKTSALDTMAKAAKMSASNRVLKLDENGNPIQNEVLDAFVKGSYREGAMGYEGVVQKALNLKNKDGSEVTNDQYIEANAANMVKKEEESLAAGSAILKAFGKNFKGTAGAMDVSAAPTTDDTAYDKNIGDITPIHSKDFDYDKNGSVKNLDSIKKGGKNGAGKDGHPGLMQFAADVQNISGVEKEVTSINDSFHQRVNPGSAHPDGRAVDFTVKGNNKQEQIKNSLSLENDMRSRATSAGLIEGKDFKILNEYIHPSKNSTAGHVHFQFQNKASAEKYLNVASGKAKDAIHTSDTNDNFKDKKGESGDNNINNTSHKSGYSDNSGAGIGHLNLGETRELFNEIRKKESSGKPSNIVNGLGYLGKYQMGAAALAEAGFIKGGADAVKKAKGNFKTDDAWARSGGMEKFLENKANWNPSFSKEKFLNDESLQDAAMFNYTASQYQQGIKQGAINKNTPHRETMAFLMASHIAGVGGAIKVLKGENSAGDVNGTTAKDYYNHILTGGSGDMENNVGNFDSIVSKNLNFAKPSGKGATLAQIAFAHGEKGLQEWIGGGIGAMENMASNPNVYARNALYGEMSGTQSKSATIDAQGGLVGAISTAVTGAYISGAVQQQELKSKIQAAGVENGMSSEQASALALGVLSGQITPSNINESGTLDQLKFAAGFNALEKERASQVNSTQKSKEFGANLDQHSNITGKTYEEEQNAEREESRKNNVFERKKVADQQRVKAAEEFKQAQEAIAEESKSPVEKEVDSLLNTFVSKKDPKREEKKKALTKAITDGTDPEEIAEILGVEDDKIKDHLASRGMHKKPIGAGDIAGSFLTGGAIGVGGLLLNGGDYQVSPQSIMEARNGGREYMRANAINTAVVNTMDSYQKSYDNGSISLNDLNEKKEALSNIQNKLARGDTPSYKELKEAGVTNEEMEKNGLSQAFGRADRTGMNVEHNPTGKIAFNDEKIDENINKEEKKESDNRKNNYQGMAEVALAKTKMTDDELYNEKVKSDGVAEAQKNIKKIADFDKQEGNITPEEHNRILSRANSFTNGGKEEIAEAIKDVKSYDKEPGRKDEIATSVSESVRKVTGDTATESKDAISELKKETSNTNQAIKEGNEKENQNKAHDPSRLEKDGMTYDEILRAQSDKGIKEMVGQAMGTQQVLDKDSNIYARNAEYGELSKALTTDAKIQTQGGVQAAVSTDVAESAIKAAQQQGAIKGQVEELAKAGGNDPVKANNIAEEIVKGGASAASLIAAGITGAAGTLAQAQSGARTAGDVESLKVYGKINGTKNEKEEAIEGFTRASERDAIDKSMKQKRLSEIADNPEATNKIIESARNQILATASSDEERVELGAKFNKEGKDMGFLDENGRATTGNDWIKGMATLNAADNSRMTQAVIAGTRLNMAYNALTGDTLTNADSSQKAETGDWADAHYAAPNNIQNAKFQEGAGILVGDRIAKGSGFIQEGVSGYAKDHGVSDETAESLGNAAQVGTIVAGATIGAHYLNKGYNKHKDFVTPKQPFEYNGHTYNPGDTIKMNDPTGTDKYGNNNADLANHIKSEDGLDIHGNKIQTETADSIVSNVGRNLKKKGFDLFKSSENTLEGTNNKSNNTNDNSSNGSQSDKSKNTSHNKSPLINDEFTPDGTNPISDYSTEGLNNKLTSDELEGAKEHNDINRENVIAMDNKTAGQKSLLSRLENAKSKATTPRDIERISQLQDTIKDAFSENGSSMTEKAFSEVKGYIGEDGSKGLNYDSKLLRPDYTTYGKLERGNAVDIINDRALNIFEAQKMKADSPKNNNNDDEDNNKHDDSNKFNDGEGGSETKVNEGGAKTHKTWAGKKMAIIGGLLGISSYGYSASPFAKETDEVAQSNDFTNADGVGLGVGVAMNSLNAYQAKVEMAQGASKEFSSLGKAANYIDGGRDALNGIKDISDFKGVGTLGGVGKAAGKSLLKKLPGLGVAMGAYMAYERAETGDYIGAGMELVSGIVSIVPGIGTAASVAIDSSLLAKDAMANNSTITSSVGGSGGSGSSPQSHRNSSSFVASNNISDKNISNVSSRVNNLTDHAAGMEYISIAASGSQDSNLSQKVLENATNGKLTPQDLVSTGAVDKGNIGIIPTKHDGTIDIPLLGKEFKDGITNINGVVKSQNNPFEKYGGGIVNSLSNGKMSNMAAIAIDSQMAQGTSGTPIENNPIANLGVQGQTQGQGTANNQAQNNINENSGSGGNNPGQIQNDHLNNALQEVGNKIAQFKPSSNFENITSSNSLAFKDMLSGMATNVPMTTNGGNLDVYNNNGMVAFGDDSRGAYTTQIPFESFKQMDQGAIEVFNRALTQSSMSNDMIAQIQNKSELGTGVAHSDQTMWDLKLLNQVTSENSKLQSEETVSYLEDLVSNFESLSKSLDEEKASRKGIE